MKSFADIPHKSKHVFHMLISLIKLLCEILNHFITNSIIQMIKKNISSSLLTC